MSDLCRNSWWDVIKFGEEMIPHVCLSSVGDEAGDTEDERKKNKHLGVVISLTVVAVFFASVVGFLIHKKSNRHDSNQLPAKQAAEQQQG